MSASRFLIQHKCTELLRKLLWHQQYWRVWYIPVDLQANDIGSALTLVHLFSTRIFINSMLWLLFVAIELGLTGDTPNVTGNTVDIQFLLQGCADVSCSVSGGSPANLPPAQDCKCQCYSYRCTWKIEYLYMMNKTTHTHTWLCLESKGEKASYVMRWN